jgi:hypothetical protein
MSDYELDDGIDFRRRQGICALSPHLLGCQTGAKAEGTQIMCVSAERQGQLYRSATFCMYG